MTGESVTIASPSIGAQNTDLSKFILNSDDTLQENYYRLHGYYKAIVDQGDGKSVIIWKQNKSQAFNSQCISFIDAKLSQLINKDQKLTNYLTSAEMNKEAFTMVLSFIDELYLQSRDFECNTPEKFKVLVSLYSNFVSQILRQALYDGHRQFLSKTTNETTQKIQQSITEQTQKNNGFKLPLIGGL